MSGIRKFTFAVILAGVTLVLPMPSQATRMCSTGGPNCPSTPSACDDYCQQQGLIWDSCNLQTGCCTCIVK